LADELIDQFRFDGSIDDVGDRLLIVFSKYCEGSKDNGPGLRVTERPPEPTGAGVDERGCFRDNKPECPGYRPLNLSVVVF
jgi:hypothetical protein